MLLHPHAAAAQDSALKRRDAQCQRDSARSISITRLQLRSRCTEDLVRAALSWQFSAVASISRARQSFWWWILWGRDLENASCQLDLKARESAAHLTHSRAAIARGNLAKICFWSELWLLKRKLFSFKVRRFSLLLLLFRIQLEMLNGQVWVEFTHPAF